MDELNRITKYLAATGVFTLAFGFTACACSANKQDTAAGIALALAFGGAVLTAVIFGTLIGSEHYSFHESSEDRDDDDDDISG